MPDPYLAPSPLWSTLEVTPGCTAAELSLSAMLVSTGRRRGGAPGEEETPKEAEPRLDALQKAALSCRSPSSWHQIKQPCRCSDLHWGVALSQVLGLKRPEPNKLSTEPVTLKRKAKKRCLSKFNSEY